MTVASSPLEICELPPCELVRRSCLRSERCGTGEQGWPLLITATPRSATVYATKMLQGHGMQIQQDWSRTKRDGRVSWIFAFEDPKNFGPARTGGKTYGTVLHQVKEPLGSITSMCIEPVLRGELEFLRRHIPLNASYESPAHKSRAVLEFWVEWHTFLEKMKFPTFRIEDVKARDIFHAAGLDGLYKNATKMVSSKTNARKHRGRFTWRELYTIDPLFAARAWEMAHHFGYSYPDVDFDSLTCLEYLPSCGGGKNDTVPPNCPNGTHPYPPNGTAMAVNVPNSNETLVKGWVDPGCIEYKLGGGDNGTNATNATYVGLTGLVSKFDPGLTDEVVRSLMLQRANKRRHSHGSSSNYAKQFSKMTALPLVSKIVRSDELLQAPMVFSVLFVVSRYARLC